LVISFNIGFVVYKLDVVTQFLKLVQESWGLWHGFGLLESVFVFGEGRLEYFFFLEGSRGDIFFGGGCWLWFVGIGGGLVRIGCF
jgi:hypothetical protein